jgi:hypothetical protein
MVTQPRQITVQAKNCERIRFSDERAVGACQSRISLLAALW